MCCLSHTSGGSGVAESLGRRNGAGVGKRLHEGRSWMQPVEAESWFRHLLTVSLSFNLLICKMGIISVPVPLGCYSHCT